MQTLQILVRFRVKEGLLAQFAVAVDALIHFVNMHDPDLLQYEWFQRNNEFLVSLKGKDPEALLRHLDLVNVPFARLLDMSDFSADVMGEMSSELEQAVEGLQVNTYGAYPLIPVLGSSDEFAFILG